MPSTTQSQDNASAERKKVGMLVPPPILLLATVVLGLGLHLLLLGPFALSPARSLLGGCVIVLALISIAFSARRFKAAGTPVRPVSPATAIVSSGPYRISRNPMYVGMAALLLGLSLILGSYVLLLGLVLFIFVVHFAVVLPEERYLESLHGDTYRQYKQSVRRWL